MTLPIRLDREAENEVEAAAVFYEQRQPGLGRLFLAAVDEAFERVQKRPSSYQAPPGVSGELGIRRALLRIFPYSVVFVVLPEEIRVLAVAHGKQRPGYSRGRS